MNLSVKIWESEFKVTLFEVSEDEVFLSRKRLFILLYLKGVEREAIFFPLVIRFLVGFMRIERALSDKPPREDLYAGGRGFVSNRKDQNSPISLEFIQNDRMYKVKYLDSPLNLARYFS